MLYFGIQDLPGLMSKPFTEPEVAAYTLIRFAHLLQGLEIIPGVTVLDFGAGTCWTSRWLTQLRCKVVALDVSPRVLGIGQELYQRHPPFGSRPEPDFVVFDGHQIPLDDASVERILCFDALHHVPNPQEIIREFGRVLKDGGIAAFSEPGPNHSRSPEAQFEMRNFQVVENDIVVEDLWPVALASGFTEMRIGIFSMLPFHLSLARFEDFLTEKSARSVFAENVGNEMQDQRLFFWSKGKLAPADSRRRKGLHGELVLQRCDVQVSRDKSLLVEVRATNTSSAIWLPSGEGLGAVKSAPICSIAPVCS